MQFLFKLKSTDPKHKLFKPIHFLANIHLIWMWWVQFQKAWTGTTRVWESWGMFETHALRTFHRWTRKQVSINTGYKRRSIKNMEKSARQWPENSSEGLWYYHTGSGTSHCQSAKHEVNDVQKCRWLLWAHLRAKCVVIHVSKCFYTSWTLGQRQLAHQWRLNANKWRCPEKCPIENVLHIVKCKVRQHRAQVDE